MKGRSIWAYPKLNNNMDTEKVEVKYVGGAGQLSPITGRLSSLPLNSTKFSLLLSILSLVIAISFFCLVLAWLWGVPEKIVLQNQEVERLENLIEEQQNSLEEIMSARNKPKASMNSMNEMMSSRNRETWKLQFQPASSCLLPPSPGPCTTSSLQRWHYHAPSQRCRQFTYGGCHGNNNNFVTARQCEEMCGGVKQPQGMEHVGPSFRGISSGRDSPSGDEVPAKDLWRKRCLLPPTSGPCRGQLNRFYWDENSESCSTFSYGGCAGNTNNFLSHQECLNSCQKEFENTIKIRDASPAIPRLIAPDRPEPVSQCFQDADTGNCKSSLLRWYFHSSSSTCRMFTWGGCGGNNNNFLTEAKCEARCSSGTKEADKQKEEEIELEEEDGDIMEKEDEEVMGEAEESRDEMCSQPSNVGDCKGHLSRFFYNLESESCEEFIYGGCGGNRNNFLTEENCNKNCVHL